MTEKIQSQLQRMLSKVAQKFPATEETAIMTDIHIRINQDTGDVMVFDDDEQEITRIVVEEWIGNTDNESDFYHKASNMLRSLLEKENDGICFGKSLGIIMPYNFVLEDEQGEHIDELYIADNEDTIIMSSSLMEGLEEELDNFLDTLMKE